MDHKILLLSVSLTNVLHLSLLHFAGEQTCKLLLLIENVCSCWRWGEAVKHHQRFLSQKILWHSSPQILYKIQIQTIQHETLKLLYCIFAVAQVCTIELYCVGKMKQKHIQANNQYQRLWSRKQMTKNVIRGEKKNINYTLSIMRLYLWGPFTPWAPVPVRIKSDQ